MGYLVKALPDDDAAPREPEDGAEERSALVTAISELTDEEAELALLRELDSGSEVTG